MAAILDRPIVEGLPVRAVPVLVVYGRADRIVPAEMVRGAAVDDEDGHGPDGHTGPQVEPPRHRRDRGQAVGGDAAEQAREEGAVRHAGREHAAAIHAALPLEAVEERAHEVGGARLSGPEVPAAPRRPEQGDSVVTLGMDGDEPLAEREPPQARPPALAPRAAAKAVEGEDER